MVSCSLSISTPKLNPKACRTPLRILKCSWGALGRWSALKSVIRLKLTSRYQVRLAQSLNTKLTAQQSAIGVPNPSEQEATLIRTSLVQLGLPAPALTQDMVRDNKAYHQGLAKELGSLLVGRDGRPGLMIGKGARGVIGLDEVWGLWMRARGVGE